MNFLLATGMGCAGILSAYMASLWGRVDDAHPAAAELTRVTAAVAVSTADSPTFIYNLLRMCRGLTKLLA